MEKDNFNVLHIPIYWEKVFLFVLCGCGVLALIYFDIEAIRPRIPNEALLCVCVLGAVYNLRYYTISKYSLTAYLLGIPYRRIYWKNVKGFFYVPVKNVKNANAYRSHVVFLSMPDETNATIHTKRELDAIRRKFPFRSIEISIPRQDEEKYIPFIEDCLKIRFVNLEQL